MNGLFTGRSGRLGAFIVFQRRTKIDDARIRNNVTADDLDLNLWAASHALHDTVLNR